mgnify:CR=1 FL=1
MTRRTVPIRLRLAQLARDTRGATLVEFGIILIPLCVVLLGGLDLGYQSYVRSVLQGVLNDIARTGSLETPEVGCAGGTVEEQLECAIEDRVNTIARNATYTIEMKNFYEFSGVNRSEKLVTDYNNNGRYDPGDCWEDLNGNGVYDIEAGRIGIGGADDIVFYDVTVSMPRLVPIARFIGGSDEYRIKAQAAIRNQPYASQRVPQTVCG